MRPENGFGAGCRPALLAAVVLVAGSPLFAQVSVDCSAATTQIDMNFFAKRGWETADAELNRLWGIAKARADARGDGERLLFEQRAWLTYRDTVCQNEHDSFQGGSIAPLVYWQCMDRMTLWRNAVLGAYQ